MKSYMLYYQGKLLDEFDAENYDEAVIKTMSIVSLEEVEGE